MENKLTKKFGLITAIAMVVGTVIGSGIFFKATKVLENTEGSLPKSVLTVAVVGLIMFICSFVFSTLAQKYEKINGVVDYAEATCGPKYAYYVGWFMTFIYAPTLTATLGWVSAQYTCVLFGWEVGGDLHYAVSIIYLLAIFAMNYLSPKIAGKFQVSTTAIKLVPLVLMAIVGTIIGLTNGNIVEAFSAANATAVSSNGGLFAAMAAFAFAYEGWVLTTSINSELKNAKRNLPLALMAGAVIVVAVYILYFIGLAGVLTTGEIMGAGSNLPVVAFSRLFGSKVFGTLVSVFIVISCLGTTNGLMLACCRNMYSIAVRNEGPDPVKYSEVNPKSNIPTKSAFLALLLCLVWNTQWQFGLIYNQLPAIIGWENDELPIITLYGLYIPIFIALMIKGKELSAFKRFVMPGLGVACCGFMVYCAIASYKVQAFYYLVVFGVIMLFGTLANKSGGKGKKQETISEEDQEALLSSKTLTGRK